MDQMTRAAVFKEVEDRKNGKGTTESRLGGGKVVVGESWRKDASETVHFIQLSSKDSGGGKKNRLSRSDEMM